MNKLKCILIVDDDEVSNYLTEITIKDEDLAEKIEVALNGEEGIKKLQDLHKATDGEMPELILLDLKMPVMDGFEFLQQFHELVMENKPEIAIVTSSPNPKDRARVSDFGILGYLNKPLSAAGLIQVIGAMNKASK
jgi:CheY-like chemotaxis protein